ncbi:MAG: NADP-dependent oxidoreductase [Acidobacteria bacterium]|nr:NADP-dependent oxidoreductase [Acidobacteriota bacterium]
MPLPDRNRRFLLARVPEGMPRESDFLLQEEARPACPANGVLVRSIWISVDPYLRGRISGIRTYIDPIPAGSVMESAAVGQVVESQTPNIQAGDFVTGMWGWQDYGAVDAARVRVLDPAEAPIQTALGLLGGTGMTAYFGLTELCAPKQGETVLVSGAAGAVGSAVGQIAKILGCHVVGTTGTEAKSEYIKSLGFDGALNYRTDLPYRQSLSQLCPNGIDCYFDNVGGELTDAAMQMMNFRGRVAVCGQISQYNDRSLDVGRRPFTEILVKQLRVEGFIVTRWASRFAEGRRQISVWMKEGRLRCEETVYEGLENTPKAFIGLFRGENTGKALVHV